MKPLIVPKKLNPGDTVAFISLSGGRAGDPDMIKRYQTGKNRFEEIFGVQCECGEYYFLHHNYCPHCGRELWKENT